MEDPTWPSPGLKWNVLRKLREKALDIQHSFSQKSTSDLNSSSHGVFPQAVDLQVDESSSREIVPSSILRLEDMSWNLDSIRFPDWDPNLCSVVP